MQGIGPGTVLGGRYTAHRRLAQLRGAERWTAHDQTLEREVVLLCFPVSHHDGPATVDAARRVAGIDNSRLVRVLDVGASDGLSFVVEESLPGSHTLTSLLSQGGLPAEEVRRIVGETATALEMASQRGLHHLRLTPGSIVRTPDGSVKVHGLATTAALNGVDDGDATEASRLDAVSVVALAYAGLTSRWPLDSDSDGLESAPRVVGGVAAPSEIAAGVPSDLDALCRLTLNDDQGPLTPGDFASQIAPWSQVQIGGIVPRSGPAVSPSASAGSPFRRGPFTPPSAGRDAAFVPTPDPADTAGGMAGDTAFGVTGAAGTGAGVFGDDDPASAEATRRLDSVDRATQLPTSQPPGAATPSQPSESPNAPDLAAEEATRRLDALSPSQTQPDDIEEATRRLDSVRRHDQPPTGGTPAPTPPGAPSGPPAPGAPTGASSTSDSTGSTSAGGRTEPTGPTTGSGPAGTTPGTAQAPSGAGTRGGTASASAPGQTDPTPAPGDTSPSGHSPAGGDSDASPDWLKSARGSVSASHTPGSAGRHTGAHADSNGSQGGAAGTTAVAGAVGTAIGAAGHAAGAVGERFGTYAKAAADKATERRALRQAVEQEAERHTISLDQALLGGSEELEPPLPLLPADTAAAPTRDQSKFALTLVAGFVALALVIGLWGASRIGSSGGSNTSAPGGQKTVVVTASAETRTAGQSETTPNSAPADALAILSATGFDPEGDNQERNSEAGRVYDGDPATFWSSEGYASANLGGLKSGVGVILDLGQTVKPTSVTLNLPDAATVDLYLAPDRSLDGATQIGTSSGRAGQVELPVTTAGTGQYLIVWFTSVSQVSDGRFRATLAEVSVKG